MPFGGRTAAETNRGRIVSGGRHRNRTAKVRGRKTTDTLTATTREGSRGIACLLLARHLDYHWVGSSAVDWVGILYCATQTYNVAAQAAMARLHTGWKPSETLAARPLASERTDGIKAVAVRTQADALTCLLPTSRGGLRGRAARTLIVGTGRNRRWGHCGDGRLEMSPDRFDLLHEQLYGAVLKVSLALEGVGRCCC